MSAKPDAPTRGKCPRRCERSAGPLAVAREAEGRAIDYGQAKADEIVKFRDTMGQTSPPCKWLANLLAGAFEDGYKAAAGGPRPMTGAA